MLQIFLQEYKYYKNLYLLLEDMMMKLDIKNKIKSVCWACLAFAMIGVAIVFMAGSSCKTKTDMRELVDIPVMVGENIENSFQPKNYIDRTQLDNTFQCKSLQTGFQRKFLLILRSSCLILVIVRLITFIFVHLIIGSRN